MLTPDPSAWTSTLAQPGLVVGLTLLAYLGALRLARWSGGSALLNPTLVTIVLVAGALRLAGVSYDAYRGAAGALTFLLGPAIVLLAVPLYRRRAVVRASAPLIAGALAVGLPVGALSGAGLAWLCEGTPEVLLSLAPKSVTSGIAIGIAEKIGGVPALTAVLVIASGIVGATVGPTIARGLGVRDERVLGLAMGISGSGIATARALQMGEVAGAFAGLGMSLNGVLTAVLLPLAISLV